MRLWSVSSSAQAAVQVKAEGRRFRACGQLCISWSCCPLEREYFYRKELRQHGVGKPQSVRFPTMQLPQCAALLDNQAAQGGSDRSHAARMRYLSAAPKNFERLRSAHYKLFTASSWTPDGWATMTERFYTELCSR